MRRLALALLLATGCRAFPAETRAPTASSDAALAELAQTIDPGPQAPLHQLLTPALKKHYDARLAARPELRDRPTEIAVVEEVRAALAAWDATDRDENRATLTAAVGLAFGLLLAERAVHAGSTDPELLIALSRICHMVYTLRGFETRKELLELQDNAVSLAHVNDFTDEEIAEATAALKSAIKRAPALQMHVTARLLREHPASPAIAEALVRAAETQADIEDFPVAAALRRQAVARAGARASGEDFAELAAACFAALDLQCGDMSWKSAGERGPGGPGEARAAAFQRRLKEIAESAERARRAVALTPATGLAERTERAHLLRLLGRFGDARQEFTALREAHPDDARPLTGLAILGMLRYLDEERPGELVLAGRGLAGRDRAYYEIGLVTLPTLALIELSAAPATEVLALMSERFDVIDELIAGYRAYDPERAAVLELLSTVARASVPTYLDPEADTLAPARTLPERLLALTERFPGSRDAWGLMFSTLRLLPDPPRALALATTPLPPVLQDDPAIRLQQAYALVELVLMWEDREMLAQAREAAERLPATVDADAAETLRATLDAIQGRFDPALARQALARFKKLARTARGRARACAVNNIGVLQERTGSSGKLSFLHSDKLDRPAWVATLNLAVKYEGADLATRLSVLRGLVESPSPALRLHAISWAIDLTKQHGGDVALWRQAFADEFLTSSSQDPRATVPLGRWGVLDANRSFFSLEYSSTQGLVIHYETKPQWWLFLPSPGFGETLEIVMHWIRDRGEQARPGSTKGPREKNVKRDR